MLRLLPFMPSAPLVNVVRMSGMIAAGPRGLNDQTLAPLLERAFRRGAPKAVALVINSPGGSPTQSSLIGARIRRLAEEKEVPTVAFVEDVAASGGYWLACAADEIFVDQNSVTGSIGVISAGFGFPEALGKIGVERRVYTAGNSKSFLDPFQPEKDEDVSRLRAIQDHVHGNFIGHVKARRGAKLPEGRDLFTGEVWVGAQALEVGLADAVGHLVPEMKKRYGDKVRFNVYGPKRGFLKRLGMDALTALPDAIEERALWARYGL
ncbi:S49 family peptidase [Rhodovulum sp. 12E13]|uniref:S49 family peptidase n=1 Tax=Rhodovulum sp. 12E13 TaxID=2203891 RepID=UPI000E13FFAE|nr:S49 family peptidase [Rhodovulum sp. 12E13]RDC72141.1 S49 family peptidase [Rhodovulum sp. 12E13]